MEQQRSVSSCLPHPISLRGRFSVWRAIRASAVTSTHHSFLKAILVLASWVALTFSPAHATTISWTCPTYFTELGEPCGGPPDMERGEIPDSLTLMLNVEARMVGVTSWMVIHTFSDWTAGEPMSLVLPFDSPGTYEVRVDPIVKDVGAPRGHCPSDPVTLVLQDTCPPEKMATPVLTP